MQLKKLYRISSLFMAFLMVLSMAAGCSSKSNEAGNPTQATGTAKSDDKPLKFTLSMSNNLNEYVLKSSDINQDKWLQEMKKRYNVDITLKLLDHKRFMEEMQIMFASGSIPDVVKCFDNYTRADMAQSVQNGVFMPLDNILANAKTNYPNLMKTIPESAWQENKYEDKIYGIPNIYLSRTTRRATYIRKDLLDKVGKKAPTTLDETIEVLKAFKNAGVPFPYAGREKWSYTDIFFGAYGVNYVTWGLDKDGKLMPDMIRPEMKEALKFHSTLRKEGLMDPESLTTNSNDWLNKIYAGKVGMFDHNGGQITGFNTSLKKNVPEGEFILIPSPAGPNGQKGMYKYSPVFETTYINKNFKEADKFFKFLDAMCTPEAQEFLTFGILGQDYNKNNGKIEYTYPTDTVKQNENSFRKGLGFVRDDSYDPLMLPFQPDSKKFMDWVETIAPNEGVTNYDPGALKSLADHPELKPGNCDLFLEYAAKIFYGQLPPEAHDDFVKEYMKRGGDQVVKEATEAYKAGKAFKR